MTTTTQAAALADRIDKMTDEDAAILLEVGGSPRAPGDRDPQHREWSASGQALYWRARYIRLAAAAARRA